jgi:hypothetical protein
LTEEVKATIHRIDELIGDAHWLSVGEYKESVIRRQLVNYLPARYSVGTGFVVSPTDGDPIRSKQIDVLIWDSHNYAPIFADGAFVIIPPQALRVAIEVKGNLTGEMLREGLDNLDSLTQFIPILQDDHSDDEHARSGFRRYIVAAQSPLKFPGAIFDQVYAHYLKCVYDDENPTDQHVQLTIDQRIEMAKSSLWWGLTPLISGISILGAGMIRAVRFGGEIGYFVPNDVEQDGADHTIGQIRQSIDRFLTTDVIRKHQRDYAMTGREANGWVMPVPFTPALDAKIPAKVYSLPQPHGWTLDDARRAKIKRDERHKKRESAAEPDGGEDE